jgi:uncharacterized sulfatase
VLSPSFVFADSADIGLPETEPTLAELLSDAGVRTAGVNAGNGFLTAHWGYDRGFDEFESFVPDTSLFSKYLAAHPTVQSWLRLAKAPFSRSRAFLAGDRDRQLFDSSRLVDVEDRAVSFIDSVDDEPFFLWIHYMDPHTPYVPAPRYVREETDVRVGSARVLAAHLAAGLGTTPSSIRLDQLRSLYRAAVRQTDDSVRRVLEALAESGLREETCVVLAGDHGEEFQEHGNLAHYPKLYEELVHVPFVVDLPGTPGRRVESAVGLESIPPTVCDAMGLRPTQTFAGESLFETVVRGCDPTPDPVVSVTVRGESVTQQPIPRGLDEGETLVSARTQRWSYIHHTGSGRRELYDRVADPGEQQRVWPSMASSSVVERLHRAGTRRVDRINACKQRKREEPPSSVTDRLSALGYR